MANRPYWTGRLKISLVSFGVQLFPASNSLPGVAFHLIDRKTGERIHHLNVVGEHEKPVDDSDIVKGFEYSKGKYIILEPDEISRLRIESNRVIEIKHFVNLDELHPALFERPYFVVPDPKQSPGAFAVIRKALDQTGKAALGELAFAGREHLIAVAVPPDKSFKGLMAYTLRYEEELRAQKNYAPKISDGAVDKKQLEMATELIRAYSSPLRLADYKDDYEAAVRKLIEAKRKNKPLPLEEEKPQKAQVVNLMDALRRSVGEAKAEPRKKRSSSRASKKGPMLVKAPRRSHRAA
ncbi:MAG TPA: Ku protein [Terracidiphilus sp.]|nr:Ku protein [Terracidiphilus sp.]